MGNRLKRETSRSLSLCFLLLTPWAGAPTFQCKMREVRLGAHTLRSHGIKVAKTHMHDWIILVLLGVIIITLDSIQPFYRYVGESMMTDLKYPLKGNTIPFWAVPMISVLLPISVVIAIYFRRRDVYDLHHAILGLLFSTLLTGVITSAIKDAVGRPRPDFFWRCFPDGKPEYHNVTGNVVCHGAKSVIKEGHKSFPSGHSSWSFAGLAFLALYLSGKIKVFDRRGHVAKLCIVFLPLLIASLVAISRVDDYWHHWQDVFAGGLIGTLVAIFCYLQFFPAPYHTDGWGPHAYFKMLEESRATGQSDNFGISLGVPSTEGALACEQVEGDGNHIGLSMAGSMESRNDDVEAGRRHSNGYVVLSTIPS